MRVCAGKYKGRKLLENKLDSVRPTTDKVKQALFVKLQFFVPNKRVLDLFCGTGAIGIEALSRGAESVLFVDISDRSCQMTRQNLKNLNIDAKVVKIDAQKFVEICKEKYDLIFLDPPYKSGLYEKILPKLPKILNDGGIVVCEHASDIAINYAPFVCYDEKKYGNIKLAYLELEE